VKYSSIKPPKAYKDLEFLNSPDARVIRMLSEFLEPQRRFRQQKIKDTIVFFGSARIVPAKDARAQLRAAQKAAIRKKKPDRALQEALTAAEVRLEMSRYYEDTVELARLLTKWSRTLSDSNRFVVCSGGGPGIMEAANRGAFLARGKSLGLNISLPFEQFANPFISEGLAFEFHYFFMRKFWFAYLAKALVIMPGGFGTMDELFEALTLIQTRRIKSFPVILMGSEYWKGLLEWLKKTMIRTSMILPEDLDFIEIIDDPDEVVKHIQKFVIV